MPPGFCSCFYRFSSCCSVLFSIITHACLMRTVNKVWAEGLFIFKFKTNGPLFDKVV